MTFLISRGFVFVLNQGVVSEAKSLDEKEMQDLRSIIGQISWLTGISCPDLSFENFKR